MSDWTLFSRDPVTGVTTWVRYDEGRLTFRQETPLDDIFTANADEFNSSSGERFGDMRRVARMPMSTFMKHLGPAQANGDMEYVKRFLNDPDNRKFRTFGGTL